jgi:hypothetical protein
VRDGGIIVLPFSGDPEKHISRPHLLQPDQCDNVFLPPSKPKRRHMRPYEMAPLWGISLTPDDDFQHLLEGICDLNTAPELDVRL